MYPGFIPYWMRHDRGESRASSGCGPGASSARRAEWSYHLTGREESVSFDFGGGAFGVRRPLRFLAYKLQLEEAQIAELARILDEIKTERAQAAVDHRRAISAFADSIEGDVFQEEKVKAGAATRLASAERLRDAVVRALARLHKLLNSDQRTRLAYLIRTGTLSI